MHSGNAAAMPLVRNAATRFEVGPDHDRDLGIELR